MQVNKNGAIIDSVSYIDNSVMGDDYIVMWDNSGLPIHIHKHVISELNKKITPTQPELKLEPLENFSSDSSLDHFFK